jgi:L,D-transpeptidase YcbB
MRRFTCAGMVCGLLVCTVHSAPVFQDVTDADVLIWVDAGGFPSQDARDALTLLRDAATDGLDPADYDSAFLDSLATELNAERRPSARNVATFNAALSGGMVRYLRHLHSGRVDPRTAGFRLSVPADEHDFAAVLRAALAGHRLIETVAEFTPPLALYRGLRSMLARYRSLAAGPSLERLPMFVATVRPGDPYADLAVLHDRLVALGDLPAGGPRPRSRLCTESRG